MHSLGDLGFCLLLVEIVRKLNAASTSSRWESGDLATNYSFRKVRAKTTAPVDEPLIEGYLSNGQHIASEHIGRQYSPRQQSDGPSTECASNPLKRNLSLETWRPQLPVAWSYQKRKVRIPHRLIIDLQIADEHGKLLQSSTLMVCRRQLAFPGAVSTSVSLTASSCGVLIGGVCFKGWGLSTGRAK